MDNLTEVELEHVKVLRLQPGDVVVIKATRPITAEEAVRIKNTVSDRFPDHEVLVLDPSVDLTVARPDMVDEPFAHRMRDCDLPDSRTAERGQSHTCSCGRQFTAVGQQGLTVWLNTGTVDQT